MVMFSLILVAAVASAETAEVKEHLRLLSSNGIPTESADLISWLEKLRPTDKLQAEVATLVEQLASENFNTRELAFKRLSTFGEAARAQLNKAHQSKDPEVSWRAGQILKQMDSDDQSHLQQSLAQAALLVLKSRREPRAAATILATLPVLKDESTRATACEAPWACANRKHVVAMEAATKHDDPLVRATAIVAWEVAASDAGGDIAEAAIGKIEPLLEHESSIMRLAAARALVDHRPRSTIQTLIGLTSTEDQEVVWQADALLHLKTGQQVELNERLSLHDAWKVWQEQGLASADLSNQVGAKRLDLSAGRNTLKEAFLANQPSVAKGYGRFLYESDNQGDAKAVDGKLRIDGDNDEGDQRLYLTSQRMIGRDRWPDKLEVRARLGAEEGNNYGWHVGVSVGQVKVLFHPGESMGYFRAETTDEHDYIFSNEDLNFSPATGVMHEMILQVEKTQSGATFKVTVNDGKSDKSYQRKFTVSEEQLGDFNRIGLERSGRRGGDAVFESLSVRLGR